MIFAVLFEDDNVRADDIRRQYLPAHLTFLERHATAIRAAGPLQNADGSPAGGLWLVSAERDRVEQLIQEDPFWPTGLRRSVKILAWKQVFADGTPLVDLTGRS